MDAGALIALVSIVGSLALTGLVVVGAWALGRVHERRNALARGDAAERRSEELLARLERIEHLLDTMSTDVERLTEERRGPVLPR